MADMKWWDVLTLILLIAGGLNWGLVAWFNFDLVTFLSFGVAWIEWLVKTLVGAAGIYGLVYLVKQWM